MIKSLSSVKALLKITIQIYRRLISSTNSLIKTDWAKVARYFETKCTEKVGKKKRSLEDECDDENWDEYDGYHYFNKIDFDLVSSLPPIPDGYVCQSVSFDSKSSSFLTKFSDKRKSKFYRKVCQFEGRGNLRKGIVFCPTHGLHNVNFLNIFLAKIKKLLFIIECF